ncbi:manganese efflux pump MntP family protein [Paenibacillus thermoaerophilus]|jgi:putative Mn2+ efflux pump MntP|uniref:Putative manganese efflux pump MntP n=1 Tax=Paenibacillus thermoaerophilus TaxID=1215385 RepID=A0ABW2V4S5_9BACL|nr:manganese efflux pump MntP family protein [Paenibacillus thermoaerophilus]TMV12468.1 manganese efflux pump [Paenibacillus thermoaerophilus]
MVDTAFDLGQVVTILFMAVALGMDAFSLGIGIGLRGIRLKQTLSLGLLIGFLHMALPLLGMAMGMMAGRLLGSVAALAGGCLLILLGAHMIWNAVREEQRPVMNISTLWSMIFFALTVSMDAMSVGVSMGLIASDTMLTIAVFGIVGTVMSVSGLLIGRRVHGWIGEYGEAIGGAMLLAFGISFIF